MDRLLQYLHTHYYLAAVAALVAVAVAVYEFRARAQDFSAVLPQEAIRLMNQGAVVFDVRGKESHEGGHITGARVLTEDQIASAGESRSVGPPCRARAIISEKRKGLPRLGDPLRTRRLQAGRLRRKLFVRA